MNRQSLVVGFLAGGWLATILLVTLGHVGLPVAGAEEPPREGPAQPFGPSGPQLPGPSVNPPGAIYARGGANPGLGTSDSNHRAIALSASIGGGQSVVYYFDTVAQRLCVYQYTPGTRGGLRLLAARLIDFDLKLEAYRDLSEKSPREMREAYEEAMNGGRGGGPIPTRRVELPGSIR